jgi:hypothetical protein
MAAGGKVTSSEMGDGGNFEMKLSTGKLANVPGTHVE